MRNMSFSATTEQIRNGTKTVTRRLGWTFLKPGDVAMTTSQCQGLKKGEKVEKIRPIRIVSVRREKLHCIPKNDLALEGFPDIGKWDFIDMFCKMNKCKRWDLVTRIEFEYICIQLKEKP